MSICTHTLAGKLTGKFIEKFTLPLAVSGALWYFGVVGVQNDAFAQEPPAQDQSAPEPPPETAPSETLPEQPVNPPSSAESQESTQGDELTQPEKTLQPEPPVQPEQQGRGFGAGIPVEEKNIRINVRYQPWKDVIEFFAEQADLSLRMDTYPQGTFNYRDDTYYTPTEAIDLLNGYLLLDEFLLVRKGKVLIVQDLSGGGGLAQDLVETIFPKDLPKRGAYEVVRVQFVLKRITPAEVQAEIEQVLSPLGRVSVMPMSQVIQITDTVANLRAIREVIDRLDTTNIDETLKSVDLKNISSEEALSIMRTLMRLTAEDQNLRAVADMSGKKIWLSGRPDLIQKAIAHLEGIDESYTDAVQEYGELQLRTYTISTADPTTFLAVCQTMLAGTPGIRISLDQNTNTLIANAYAENHRTINAILEQMESEVLKIDVIRLGKLTTKQASDAIDKFFNTDSGETNKAPVVEADAINKQLIVRASRVQLDQIRNLLQVMGETGDGWTPGNAESENSGKTRTINLSPGAAALILEQLPRIWSANHENDIRVIDVSGSNAPGSHDSSGNRSTAEPNPAFSPNADELYTREVSMQEKFMQEMFRRFLEEEERKYREKSNDPFSSPMQPEIRDKIHNEDRVDEEMDRLFGPPRSEDSATPPSDGSPNDQTTRRGRGNSRENDLRGGVFRTVQYTRNHDAQDTQNVQNAQNRGTGRNSSGAASSGVVAAHSEQGLSPEALAYLRGANPTKGSPITLSVGPAGLVLESEDREALDSLQALIETMSNEAFLATPVLKQYFLNYVSASNAESMLRSLLGTSGSTDDSEPLDDIAAGMILSTVGGLGIIQATGEVTITSDARLNMIWVRANPVDHYTIEKKLLPLLDVAESPEKAAINQDPRMIALKHISAQDAMDQVRAAFPENLQQGTMGAGGNARGGQMNFGGAPPGFNPQMMQQIVQQMQQGQGRGGRNAGGANNTRQEEVQKMTLGIVESTNTLIVNAPEVLFRKVRDFVEMLDENAAKRDEVVVYVTPKWTNPGSLVESVKRVGGDSIQATSSNSSGTFSQRGAVTSANVSTGQMESTSSATGGTGRGGFGGFGGFGGGASTFPNFGGGNRGGFGAGGFVIPGGNRGGGNRGGGNLGGRTGNTMRTSFR